MLSYLRRYMFSTEKRNRILKAGGYYLTALGILVVVASIFMISVSPLTDGSGDLGNPIVYWVIWGSSGVVLLTVGQISIAVLKLSKRLLNQEDTPKPDSGDVVEKAKLAVLKLAEKLLGRRHVSKPELEDVIVRVEMRGSDEHRATSPRTGPNYVLDRLDTGDMLVYLGKPKGAETAYRKASQAQPGCLKALYGRGHALTISGSYSRAAEIFEMIIDRYPNEADAWYYKGKALQLKGKSRESENAFFNAADCSFHKAEFANRLYS